MWGQRMLRICEMYSISEKNSAVNFVDQHTTIWKTRSLFAFKQKSPVIETNRKGFPFFFASSMLAEI